MTEKVPPVEAPLPVGDKKSQPDFLGKKKKKRGKKEELNFLEDNVAISPEGLEKSRKNKLEK